MRCRVTRSKTQNASQGHRGWCNIFQILISCSKTKWKKKTKPIKSLIRPGLTGKFLSCYFQPVQLWAISLTWRRESQSHLARLKPGRSRRNKRVAQILRVPLEFWEAYKFLASLLGSRQALAREIPLHDLQGVERGCAIYLAASRLQIYIYITSNNSAQFTQSLWKSSPTLGYYGRIKTNCILRASTALKFRSPTSVYILPGTLTWHWAADVRALTVLKLCWSATRYGTKHALRASTHFF